MFWKTKGKVAVINSTGLGGWYCCKEGTRAGVWSTSNERSWWNWEHKHICILFIPSTVCYWNALLLRSLFQRLQRTLPNYVATTAQSQSHHSAQHQIPGNFLDALLPTPQCDWWPWLHTGHWMLKETGTVVFMAQIMLWQLGATFTNID